MKARSLSWIGVLPLAACGTNHRIEVETTIAADGTTKRALVFHVPNAEEPDSTWSVFARPEDPYRVEAVEETFRAEASFGAGVRPGGIRPILWDPSDAAATAPAPRDGTFSIEVSDLVLGRLYRYRETIEIGVDLDATRRALDRWLRRGLDLSFEALRRRYPDVDLARLESHARGSLLPRFEGIVVETHLRFLDWWRTYRALEPDPDDDLAHKERFWRLFEEGCGRLGIVYARPPGEKADLDDLFEEGDFDFSEFVAREIAPHLDRESPLLALFEKEALAALGKEVEAVFDERHPEGGEERRRWEAEGSRDAAFAFGFPILRVFDLYRVRATLRVRGRVLRTNGEIAAEPGEVRWSLSNEHFWFVSPDMHALAFDPESWARADAEGKERRWDLAALRAWSRGLEGVSGEERDALRRLLRSDLGLDAEAPPEGLEASLGERAGAAREMLRESLLRPGDGE